MIDLNKRMEELRRTVEEKTRERKLEQEQHQKKLDAQKMKDWSEFSANEPELASFIRGMSEAFGKPKLVVALRGKEIILDSRNYAQVHDKAGRRR